QRAVVPPPRGVVRGGAAGRVVEVPVADEIVEQGGRAAARAAVLAGVGIDHHDRSWRAAAADDNRQAQDRGAERARTAQAALRERTATPPRGARPGPCRRRRSPPGGTARLAPPRRGRPARRPRTPTRRWR